MFRYFEFASLLLCLALVPAFSQERPERKGNLTIVKLGNFGWEALPKTHEWAGTGSRLVSIDHRGRVLVGFTTRENTALATRQHPGLSFHILRFTSEGKEDLSLVLPTDNWFNNGLYLGWEDRIYARAGSSFQFLSEQQKALDSNGTWKRLVPCSMACEIMQSPSRRTLVLRDSQGQEHRNYIIQDTPAGLPPEPKDCRWIDTLGQAITDRFAYQSTDGIETDARRWPLCEQGRIQELPLDMRNGALFPLSDQAFVLLGSTLGQNGFLRGVDVIASDGKLKFQQELPKHDTVAYGAASDERGDRFAFSVQTWSGGSRFLDISGKLVARRIVVYSENNQELASVPVSTTYRRDFDFALSPDGHRLAILDEGVLTVADLK